MIAVKDGTEQGIIGFLFWYSIGSGMIHQTELQQHIEDSGVGLEWMPNPIRTVDAYRKATKKVERKLPSDKVGITRRLKVVEVASDKDIIQRNLVIETVDSNNKNLNYETTVGISRLDKKHESLSLDTGSELIKEIGREIDLNFQLFKEHYTAENIRQLVPKILGSLAPTPLRNNGGIYFIPIGKKTEFSALLSFINNLPLEGSRASKVDMISSTDNNKTVEDSLEFYLDSLLIQCRNTEGLKKGQIKALVEETNRTIDQYKEYRSILLGKEQHFNEKVITLRNEVINLLNN